jgi:diguanylate cyclase (GGDEF)-like protein
MAAAVLLIAVYFLLDPDAQALLYELFGLSAVAAILLGVRRYQPRALEAWYLVAFGLCLFVAGDVAFSWYERVLHATPFPSVADLLYLGGYPFLALGMWRFVRARAPGVDIASVLDAATIAIGVAVASWIFLITPSAVAGDVPLVDRLVSGAYPVADLLLLALSIRLVVGTGLRPLPFYLLCLSMGFLLVTDTAFVVLTLSDGYVSGDAIDSGWLLSYLLIGAAALHPRMIDLTRATHVREARPSVRRFVMLAGASLVAPAILAVQAARGEPIDVPVIVLGSVALFLMVLVRAAGLAFESARLSDRMRRLAFHDELTGLPNRSLLRDRVAHALSADSRGPGRVALFLIDIDDFKTINDTLGHAAGDRCLAVFARRLESCLRSGDTVGRLAGDEFALLLPRIAANEVRAVADRVVATLALPLTLDGTEVFAPASIGIVLATPEHDVDTLLRDADLAMYAAKASGKRHYEFFDPAMHASLADQMGVDAALRHAIERGELTVYYQPLYDVHTRRVVMLEALVRWARSDGTLLLPAAFLSRADDLGLLPALGRFVLDRALAQLALWQRDAPEIAICVNLSPGEVHDEGLVRYVTAALDMHGIAPRSLVLEISERTALGDPRIVVTRLLELRGLGVQLALDDFGTHATLGLLRQLPVDLLKMDRSLVRDLPEPRAYAFAKAVVALAGAMEVRIVAEGVESEDHLVAVRTMGCHLAQGFHLARPVPAESATALLAGGGSAAPLPALGRRLTD